MGLGILDDHHLEHVPGTSLFNDDPNAAALSAYEGFDLGKLKHAKGKNAHIVLVPQPSDDPNDPLNWPKWKKHMIMLTQSVYGTTICGALGPLVSADLVNIAIELDRSVQALARALGSALVLALALATVVWSVMSVKIGKRPVFLMSTLLMFAGTMISSYSRESSLDVLSGSRILQGVGQAVLEFLVGASIADIYFTHERGIPVALWNLALLDGINITPPISGPVIENRGWRFSFKMFSISCGVLFLLQVFCMPETTYHRKPLKSENINPQKVSDSSSNEKKQDIETISNEEPSTPPVPPQKTYWEELRIYNGIYPTSASVWSLLMRPFIACCTPVCLWASLLYGVAITWLVLIATSVSQIFSAPPYNFSPENVGLTYMSPFIFATIAAALCGPLTDYVAKTMSKANLGIFEPEFRLILVAFYAVFGSMGFFGWGISANDQDPWIGPVIFFGLISFGTTIGCSAAIGYVVDAHRQSADSALGGVIAFSFAITFFINDWLADRGILNVFGIVGGITLFTSLLTIPMYIYGKRARSWIHRTVRMDEDETTVVAH
ncbi:MFS general substrate transporter [Schizopora paradoxa]|uniref:MFS general substrate transporter n=1 Tax=Schizopora paradoxa TaxID=27342 RepID=A0A0H2RNB6_9AGAM|nr:MFS general substrate transporter [Schizopora paradoxa]